jgi:hypothetical protein
MMDIPVLGFWKYWTQKLASVKCECYAIMNRYPDAAYIVQEVYKVLSDIENLAGCTLAEVGEISEWTPVVNSVEENRANFCKAVDGKLLFSALYVVYPVTLNEMKAVLKVSAQAAQSGAVNRTSGESSRSASSYVNLYFIIVFSISTQQLSKSHSHTRCIMSLLVLMV